MIPYTLLEFDEVESTSNFLKENQTYFPHMTIIKANHQTGGRGQFDRIWESKPHENILFSILLKEIKFDEMYKIKGWIVTSIMTFFHQYQLISTFKEPNDLYIQDKKICGILIETQSTLDQFNYAIIGIGINVNQMTFSESRATSMKNETKIDYDIKTLFDHVLSILMKEYRKIYA